MDSRELAEWQAFTYLDYFDKQFKERALTVDEKSIRLEDMLFGKAKAQGIKNGITEQSSRRANNQGRAV